MSGLNDSLSGVEGHNVNLRQAAEPEAGGLGPFVLPESADGLKTRERELVLHMIRVLLDED